MHDLDTLLFWPLSLTSTDLTRLPYLSFEDNDIVLHLTNMLKLWLDQHSIMDEWTDWCWRHHINSYENSNKSSSLPISELPPNGLLSWINFLQNEKKLYYHAFLTDLAIHVYHIWESICISLMVRLSVNAVSVMATVVL